MQPQGTFGTVQPRKEGKGCFFYGCLTVIVLIVLSAVAVYFAMRGMLTVGEPIILATVDATVDEIQQARDKFEKLSSAIKSSSGSEEFQFSEKELNLLITSEPKLAKFKDMIRVRINADELGGVLSIPTGMFGFPGRFVHLEGSFTLSFKNGQLVINPKRVVANGKTLPDEVMAQLRTQNLAEGIKPNAEGEKLMARIASVTVESGGVVIKLK